MSTIVFITTMNTAARRTTAATTGRSPLKIAVRRQLSETGETEHRSVTIAPASSVPDVDTELGGDGSQRGAQTVLVDDHPASKALSPLPSGCNPRPACRAANCGSGACRWPLERAQE